LRCNYYVQQFICRLLVRCCRCSTCNLHCIWSWTWLHWEIRGWRTFCWTALIWLGNRSHIVLSMMLKTTAYRAQPVNISWWKPWHTCIRRIIPWCITDTQREWNWLQASPAAVSVAPDLINYTCCWYGCCIQPSISMEYNNHCNVQVKKPHCRSAHVWHALSMDHTVLPAHPRFYLRTEWTAIAFAFSAKAGSYLPTPEG